MARTTYALATDVTRRFDPTLTQSQLESDDFIGQDDLDTIRSRLEGVESTWDHEATPMRAVPVGSRDAPQYFDAKGSPWPVTIYLDHRNVAPLDPNQGDFIKTRTGRDDYSDITGREGSAWVADYDMGVITVYRYPGAGQLPAFHRIRDRFVKIAYHLGAGGDFAAAGQTTLAEDVSADATPTVSVTDVDRLPRSGEYTMLLGGAEYVGARVADLDAGTVELTARGRRRTDAQQAHASGTTLHYCPMTVREAVAAKTARELVIYDDYTDWLVEGSEAFDRQSKLDAWDSEWTQALGNFSTTG